MHSDGDCTLLPRMTHSSDVWGAHFIHFVTVRFDWDRRTQRASCPDSGTPSCTHRRTASFLSEFFWKTFKNNDKHSREKTWMLHLIKKMLGDISNTVSQELTWLFKTTFLYSHVPFPQFILDVALVEDVPLVLLHQEHDDRSVTTMSVPAKRHHSYLTAWSWILGQNSSQLLHQLLKKTSM